MSEPLRVLLVEDSESDAWLIVRNLEKAGYSVQACRVDTAETLRAALADPVCDVIIADYHLPQFDAPAALDIARKSGHDIPFLVVSGTVGEDRAVAMMKAGAQDYLMKGNLTRLAPAVGREMREAASRRELRRTESERRRLEDQFRQAQRLESIGRVTGAVAHDFNNLLTVITGYASMGIGGLTPLDPMYEVLTQIDAAAKRAADLATRLLGFSRPQPAHLVDLVLNERVRNFETMLAHVLGKTVRLCLLLDCRAAVIHADTVQIEQILMNLAVNARDAMPRGGKLTIETCSIPAAHQVQLRVSDTGMGMTPAVMARIFEPFFTTKDEGKGTGLGLATVYGIVKQTRGSIEVASEVGQGTTFTLVFPALAFENPGSPPA
jgi:two-component system, cell cycle sensor histidine kinase and response regulator CckA